MRRKDLSIDDPAVQAQLIQSSHHMVLGLIDGGKPYTVPLNFGYADGKIYFHSAREGRKIAALRQAGGQMPVSGVLVSHAEPLLKGDKACDIGTEYASVMFEGVAEEVTDADEKMQAMRTVLKHLGQEQRPLPPENLNMICVVRITVDTLSAKKSAP